MASIIVPSSPNPVFDGSKGNVFETTLTSDAVPTFLNLISGVQYVFSIAQDNVGGHTFAWQANVINPTDVNPTANSITIQGFVCRSNANLYPTAPATYN